MSDLDCPFCSSDQIVRSTDLRTGDYDVLCTQCGATAPGEVWNTRALHPEPAQAQVSDAEVTDAELRAWEEQNELSGFSIDELRKLARSVPFIESAHRSKINDALEAVQSLPDCEVRRYAERKLLAAMSLSAPLPDGRS